MTTDHEQSDHDDTHGHGKRCRNNRRARFGIMAALLLGAGVLAGVLVAGAAQVSAHGWGRSSHHGRHHMSTEEARAHMEDKAQWVLEMVDGTPEQEEQVNAILAELVETLHPLVGAHRENRDQFVAALSAADVDREVLEAVRKSELEIAESAAARISEVLTEEQR